MKFLKTCVLFVCISTNCLASEESSSQDRIIQSENLETVQHIGNLAIEDVKIKTLNTLGNVKIKKSAINNIINTGNLKIKDSEVTNITETGNLKLKNTKLKILKISGNLKIKNSNIDTVECLDNCTISVKKSTIKEIKFKKEKGLVEVDDKSKIIKLTNCTILNQKNDNSK